MGNTGVQTQAGDTDPGLDLPDDVQSVLVHSPALSAHTEEICSELLTPDTTPPNNYLAISLNSTPDDRINHWKTHISPQLPATLNIIAVGDITRSAAKTASQTYTTDTSDINITAIKSVEDLTGIGIAAFKHTNSWEDTHQKRNVVCLDSITTLLQYTSAKHTYRFLHTLLTRLTSSNMLIHAHIDPAAHDTTTLSIIENLFDATLAQTADDSWELQ